MNGLRLHIDSEPGKGDVRVPIGKRRVVAECKGGPKEKKRGAPEYRQLWEAIGQLVTAKEVHTSDVLVVAVPNTPAFVQRADEFRMRPLVRQLGIQIVRVDQNGVIPPIA